MPVRKRNGNNKALVVSVVVGECVRAILTFHAELLVRKFLCLAT